MGKKVENIGNTYTSDKNQQKKKQQMRRRVVRKRITLFGGILLAIILILVVMLVTQTKSNEEASIERQDKQERYQKQQDEELALKEELNNLNDKSYIEKVARDDYYLSNDGEVIFKLPSDNKSDSKSKDKKDSK